MDKGTQASEKKVSVMQYVRWVLDIFTEAKSFESHPVIGSHQLNRFGLHVFRLLLSHSLTAFRRFILSWRVPAEYRREFKANGYILIEEALPPEQFEALKREVSQGWPEVRYFVQGDTTTEFAFLDQERLKSMPECRKLSVNKTLKHAMTYVAACGLTPWMELLNIVNQGGETSGDPQKHFHSDTFHPTMKAWLFLEDVTPEKGPFEYIKGSHKLNFERLKWEYRQSLSVKNEGETYAKRGSLRASLTDAEAMGYGMPRRFAVNENSMIIADTFGFHRRSEGDPASSRLSIGFSNRINPFLPFPVPGLAIIDRYAEKLVNQHHSKTSLVRADQQESD